MATVMHPWRGNSYNHINRLAYLADLYESEGWYPESELLYRQLLELKHGDAEDSLERAIDLYNLGLLCQLQEKYLEAEQLLLEVLVIEERLLGREHPELAITLESLSRLYDDQGRSERAVIVSNRRRKIGDILDNKRSVLVNLLRQDEEGSRSASCS